MRGPAGTGRGGVSMDGKREGQGARKGKGVRGHRLPSPPAFLAKIWQTMGTPAINAEASQSCRRPAPQAIFFEGC